MSTKKIIAVCGATGAQGGGLAQAILNDKNGPFSLRAITRNPSGEKAQALAKEGAEVVAADFDDTESLKNAFKGAYGVFAVTNYWEHFDPQKETAQAGNIAKAAKETGVEHVIWSTLEDTRLKVPLDDNRMPTLMGNYKVPHLDSKGEANLLFANLNVPTTYLYTSFYWENFIYFGAGPQPNQEGVLALTFPMGDKKLSGIAVADIGKSAYAIFSKGKEYIGKSVGIAGEHLTGHEMADAMSKALNRKIIYQDVSADVYRSFDFPGAEDLGNMFQYYRDFNDDFVGFRNIEKTRALNPELQTLKQWLAANASRIPLGEQAE